METAKTLLLGIGNPTRGDDGVGWEIVRLIDLIGLPDLETRVSQQLGLELLEEWDRFERVLFVDADPSIEDFSLERIENIDSPTSSTHHLRPEVMLRLSEDLYGGSPQLFLCRVPAHNFGFDESLSIYTRRQAIQATRAIKEWLVEPASIPESQFQEA